MNKKDKDNLTKYIRQLLQMEKDIVIVSDDIITHLEVKGKDFFLYIKSLTYAGNPYPKNTTRAQLPRRSEFNSIKESDAVFLFLGYDEVNEVFACWDPIRAKERLNERNYVSFFSRLNQQESVHQGQCNTAYLQNNSKYVLFKINDLANFLLNISIYFPDLMTSAESPETNTDFQKTTGVLQHVADDVSVKLLIDELVQNEGGYSNLAIISKCMNEYGIYYPKMSLKNWYEIICDYIAAKKTVSNVQEEIEKEVFPDEEYFDNRGETPDEKNSCNYERRIYELMQSVNNITEKKLLLVMLLSAIDFFRWYEHTYGETNTFPLLASWGGTFLNLVKQQLGQIGRESTLFSTPFIHLSDWSFWRLIPHENEQVIRGRAIKTFENLQNTYDGVEIDQELAEIIRNSNGRERLKETLLFWLSSLS